MTITNYDHIRDTELREYNGVGRLFRHRQSGCEVYHLNNDDEENLFGFIFKTVPPDSTGVAHILEHTVLCGSERFPVKDPFLQLLKGSMYTFLNALTFPDKTVYPASSTVPADLFNLMKVYGDAVFFPLLKEEMFRQEGYRLVIDEHGKLDYSGVVYNEMTGAYSTHDAIAGEMSLRSLFPDTAYGHDSGGDPREIPRLTYEQFLDFHRRYYHPSNARIFLYGNIESAQYLEFLHNEFLHRFSLSDRGAQEDISVSLQPRWSEPEDVEATYPTDQEETAGKSSVTLNWLLTDVGRPGRVLESEALADILLGSSGAPLYKALVESGLGEDLSAPSGLETELRELSFSAGLRGTDPERKEDIEELVLSTLRALRDDGIDPDVVEGTLRKMAFSNLERPGSGFGLRLMRRAARSWLHGGEPEQTMCFEGAFSELRSKVQANPRYFESLIDELLLDNTHRSTLVVRPDPNYQKVEQERLAAELAEIERSMSDEDFHRIRRRNERLEALQSEPDPPEALAAIPFLTVNDVPAEIERIPAEYEELPGGGTLLKHELDTGGIIYLDLSFDMRAVDGELYAYVPLFANAITDIGLPGIPYDAVARKLDLTTGGFSAGVNSAGHAHDGMPRTSLGIRVKALAETADEGFGLAFELLRNADFSDHRRLRDLLLEERNDVKSAVIPEGSMFAWTHAAAKLSPAAVNRDLFRGVEQLRAVVDLDPDTSIPQLADAFGRIRSQLLSKQAISAAVAGDEAGVEQGERLLREFVEGLSSEHGPRGNSGDQDSGAQSGRSHHIEGLSIPAGVGFVAKVIRGSRLGEPEYAHEGILAHLLRTGFLWEEIRMKGGAYGAFALQNGPERLFAFASYRDPNISATLDAFNRALEYYRDAPPKWSDVELAIIGMVGSEIRPLSPSQKNAVNLRRFLTGVTDELRQSRRDWLRQAGPDQVARAAARLRHNSDAESSVCVLSSREALEEAAGTLPRLADRLGDLPL